MRLCPYEGSAKVIAPGGDHTSPLMCEGHARAWQRQLGGTIVHPRRWPLGCDDYPCRGDFPNPAEIP